MLILNREATAASLGYVDCIRALEPAMISVSRGEAILPLRSYLGVPETQGKFTVMPGYSADPRSFGVKIVSKFPRAVGSTLSSHIGAVMIFEADHGLPLALLDGAELTAIRTASATALATRELARADAKTLLLIGCGEEAWHHALAISQVRKLESIMVWGRNSERAGGFTKRLADTVDVRVTAIPDVKVAVSKADIICTVTSSVNPVLQGAWLRAGTHVNLVGAAVATSAEADSEVVTRARFFTDFRLSAMAQAGELLDAIAAGLVDEDHIVAEIGQVLAGDAVGRRDAKEITVYKSLGVAAQDIAAGFAAYERAAAGGLGVEVEWQ